MKLTVPLPLPDPPETMWNHGSGAVSVHEVALFAVTATVPEPPALVKYWAEGVIETSDMVHGTRLPEAVVPAPSIAEDVI